MSEIITGIDFDYHSVKIIQVKKVKDNKFILLKLAYSTIPQGNEEEKDIRISQTIARLLKENKFRVTNLNTCINKRFVTTRYLELPSTDKEELSQMVKFQTTKLIPYSIDEIISDFQILSQQNNSSKIMLAVTHKDIVNKHLEILKKADLEPTRILISSTAIFNAYKDIQTQPFFFIAVVDIGYSSTDINFIQQEELLFSRSDSISGLQLLQGLSKELNIGFEEAERKVSTINLLNTNYISFELWLTELISKIKTSLDAYSLQEDTKMNVQKVILSGDMANLNGMDERLSKELGTEVEIGDPLRGLIVGPQMRGKYGLTEKNPQLATVIGLVMESEKERIDILPARIKTSQKQKEKRSNLLLSCILIFSLLFLFAILIERRIYDTYQYLNYLNQEISVTFPLANQIKLKQRWLKIIYEKMSNQNLALEIMAEIYKLIPANISLHEFIFDGDNSITMLQGEAKEMSEIFTLITTLEKSPYFKNVKITYATKRKTEGKGTTDFQINCPLETVISH